jgi:hypothetical protein
MRQEPLLLRLSTAAMLTVACAWSQGGPPAVDVVGLKLGMTLTEAKAQLEKYKPGIWTVVSYMTEDRTTWSWGLEPQKDGETSRHPLHDARIRIPVRIGAGYIEKAYADKAGAIQEVENQDAPIEHFSGDFFRLSFTPSDAGGRLYSMVRQRTYFAPVVQLKVLAAAGVAMPKIAELQQGVVEKYGQPAVTRNGNYAQSSYWMYDRRGMKLARDHADYSRCESRFDGEDGAMQRSPLTPRQTGPHNPLWTTRKSGKSGPLTLREITVAFQDREFYKLQYGDTKTFLGDTVNRFAREIVPMEVTPAGMRPQDMYHQNEFRGCGVGLHVVVVPIAEPDGSPSHASAITVSLSDLNAEFFDNGVEDYMKAQAAKAKIETPQKKKEVF